VKSKKYCYNQHVLEKIIFLLQFSIKDQIILNTSVDSKHIKHVCNDYCKSYENILRIVFSLDSKSFIVFEDKEKRILTGSDNFDY
jgi:CRISPR/Cas system-associated protein endoribonuclease Cas2